MATIASLRRIDPAGEIYQYTGAGKHGDQKLTGDNKALLEHAQTSRAVRVFVAESNLPGSQTRCQRYIGEFALDTVQPYFERPARDLEGNTRNVYVFQLRPVGEYLHRLEDHNAKTGSSEVTPVGVDEAPTENAQKLAYEYRQVGAKQARKRETELTARFEGYLTGCGHKVVRYKIKTAGATASQFTDLADGTAKVVYEAKGVANRVSVRLAIGQILDYGRYIKAHKPGTELSLLLPKPPPGDMISLLESLNIGCVVESAPSVFSDVTALDRCP